MREDIRSGREEQRGGREEQRGGREELPLGNVSSRGEFLLSLQQGFRQKNILKKRTFWM